MCCCGAVPELNMESGSLSSKGTSGVLQITGLNTVILLFSGMTYVALTLCLN